MGWHTFYMPGSYVAFMENPDLAHAREMNQRAKKQLEALAPMIRRGEKLAPFRVTGAGKFMTIGRPGFNTNGKGVGCGKCSRVCPLNNISMDGNVPKWGRRCTHCMACVHQCPKAAVEFRKITEGKNRYYNNGNFQKQADL